MHWIECVICKEGVSNPTLLLLKAPHYVRLRHGFVAIPIGQKLLEEFRALHPQDQAHGDIVWGEIEPDPVPTAFLEAVSRHHPIAYVRTRYFGGDGEQVAGVWEKGQLVMGPLAAAGTGPINAALRRIGIPQDTETVDEFDSLGLGRYRDMDSFK